MTTKKKTKTEKSTPSMNKEKKSKPLKKPKVPKKPKKTSKNKTVSEGEDPVKVFDVSPHPPPTNTTEKRNPKKPLKMYALIGILGLISLVLLTILIVVLLLPGPTKTKVCDSPECITLAHQLHNWGDSSVDPCKDFFKYSCGKYNEHSAANDVFTNKNNIIAGLIKEFLTKTKVTSSKSEQAMIHLYKSCMDVKNKSLAHDITVHSFRNLHTEINSMGGWPMMYKDDWKETNPTTLLTKIGRLTENEGEIRFGMFSFRILAPRKIEIHTTVEKLSEGHTLQKAFETFCEYNGIYFSESNYNETVRQLKAFEYQLHALYSAPKQQDDQRNSIPYSQLRENVKSIDFQSIIEVLHKQIESREELEKIIWAANYPVFSDKKRRLDNLIQNTPNEVITNYLIYAYFDSVMTQLSQFTVNPCEDTVTKKLPRAALRVFVRNYFNKENIEPVSDLVEDLKAGFIDMIEDSTWLQDQTKKTAINKVKKMGKVIGYPKEMEEAGALDKMFDFEINEKSSPFRILSQIEGHTIKQMLHFASKLSPINPGTLYMETNANYVASSNILTVLIPFMDNPLFDRTFPEYAKIAGIGFIIGHEIGHGFDLLGFNYDENGDRLQWYTDKDSDEYENRASCFVKQYNSYDDPSFGKNLNGSKTILEMIADDIAADVSWRTFKNSDSSNEPKIIGFEDYDIDKLFFQIIAMNWCSSRQTHSLELQLEQVHPTNSFRVNGVLSNSKSFADTFECPAGSPMNPKKKCDLF